MRTELDRLLADNPLWDHRGGVLQVTDAVGSVIRVRALLSAQDAGALFDLRCQVRECLVVWLQREHGHGLPRVRLDGGSTASDSTVEPGPEREGAALFSGSSEADERSRAFAGAR
jgi:hypothetical protein